MAVRYGEGNMADGQSNGSVRDELKRGTAEVRGLREEAAGIVEDVRDLLKSEVQLAKAEAGENMGRMMKAAMWGGVAALAALLTLFWVAFTATYVLNIWLELWASALIVTGALALITALGALMARAAIKQFSAVPRRTVNSLKEDVAWAKRQLRSSTT
jgi:uncharacterized membrane protein YqjE